jgi:hypothetical protein
MRRNPMTKGESEIPMAGFRKAEFDDIIVLSPGPAVTADSGDCVVPSGVMNVLTGAARGTKVA